MSARQVLALGSAALGALAALNSALSTPQARPQDPLPGEVGRFEWTKGAVHYVERGSGPPLILLHGIGIAASSFEMRYIVEPLAASFHVYALDLLGFGRSERPRIEYSADLYLSLIEDFMQQVTGPGVAAIGAGLSANYCVAIAARRPALISRLALSAPPPPVGGEMRTTAQRVTDLTLSTPVVGQSLFNAMTARSGIRDYLRGQAFSNPDLVTESMVDAYYAAAHQPHARHAAQAYLAGRLDLDIRESLAALKQPLLVVFGADERPAPAATAAAYARCNPRAQILVLERAAALPHEEQAERFVEAAAPWLGA